MSIESIVGLIVTVETKVLGEERLSVSFLCDTNLHRLAWHWTAKSALRSRELTARAMTWPIASCL